MSETLLAALGGGVVVAILNQGFTIYHAVKARAFQAEQRELEFASQIKKLELEFANQMARSKEERYFKIKFERYNALLEAAIPCRNIDCSKEDWAKLKHEMVACLPFMPNKPMVLFMDIEWGDKNFRNLGVEVLRKCIVAELEILHFSDQNRIELDKTLNEIIEDYKGIISAKNTPGKNPPDDTAPA